MSLRDGLFSRIGGTARQIARGAAQSNALLPADTQTTHTWYKCGRNAMGNSPGSSPYVIPWGQIFKAKDATYNPDVLLKVKYIELWFCTIAGEWTKVKRKDRVNAGQYDSLFVDPSIPPNFYSQAPAPTISELVPGRFFHFFGTLSTDHYLIPDVNDVGGLITVFEAKLISASGADISGEVGTVIGSAGADYRQTPSSNPTGDAFVGSFRPLQPYYQKFYGSTLRFPALRAKTLPSDLAQLTDRSYAPGVDPDYVAP